jgi:hypothetical protein
MKTLATLLALLMLSPVFAQSSPTTMEEARKRIPELRGLSDESAINVLHQMYYPAMDKGDLAKRLGVTLAAPPEKRKLGPIDQWRYDSCRTDAAKAPTPQGVNAGLLVCREKFGQ